MGFWIPFINLHVPSELDFKATTAFLAFLLVVWLFQRKTVPNAVPGIPLLGHIVSLALQGASFFHRCRVKVCVANLVKT